MGALSKILRNVEGGRVAFHCPGCDTTHCLPVGKGTGARWQWNGDAEKPTFKPSILVKYPCWEPPVTSENLVEWERAPWQQRKVEHVCHSYVTDGQIQFLDDCTHALKGQTVSIPNWSTDDFAGV